MLEWFSWAGEYALPVAMVSAVVANVAIFGGWILLVTFVPHWVHVRRMRRARAADPSSRYLPADYIMQAEREERRAAVGLAAVGLAGAAMMTLLAWALIKRLM